MINRSNDSRAAAAYPLGTGLQAQSYALFQKGNKNEWISPRLQEQNRYFSGRTNYVVKT